MATTKITDLTAYTDPVNTDVLPIVDVTSDVTKKVSIANVMKNASLGTAALPGVAFDGDPNTGLFSAGGDQIAIVTGGTARLTSTTTALTSTLPIDVPLGAQGTPSLTFTGDLNTGIFSPGADQVAISTGGSGRLFINSSGQVGVGTSSPGASLHVAGAITSAPTGSGLLAGINSNYGQAKLYGTTGGILDFGASGADANARLLVNNSDSALQFHTNFSGSLAERVRITSAGLVGIGTSSPGSYSAAADDLVVYNANTGGVTIATGSNTERGNINFADPGAVNAGFITYQHDLTRMLIGTETQTAITIDGSQRVGIGTSSPNSLLHLSAAGTSYFQIQNTSSGNTFYVGNSSGSGIFEVTGGNQFKFISNSSDRVVIDPSGRLLVGTSSTSRVHLIQTSAGGAANAASLAGFTIGNSNAEYPSAGYNVKFTSTSNSYEYNNNDYAVMIRYGQNSGRIETFTAASGTGGNTISFTAGPYVANAGTSWTNSSDERLKTDLVPIDDAFAKVGTLRAVTGRYKTDESSKRRSFLIAQDVQAVLPEAVDSVDPDSLGLSYSDVIPLLVAALKESKERIETLEAKVAALESV